MAPTPSSAHPSQSHANTTNAGETTLGKNDQDSSLNSIFIDLMMGTPLQIFIEKDVGDRESIVQQIQQHGGNVATGYSGAPYILVDPLKESGQNLYRQYAGKKGKLVLAARWVAECIKAGSVQTFATNFAGCKVAGNEVAPPTPSSISALQAGPSNGQSIAAPSSAVAVDIRPTAQPVSPGPVARPQSVVGERTEAPSHQPLNDGLESASEPMHYNPTVYPPNVHLNPRSVHPPPPNGQPPSWHPPGIMPARLPLTVGPPPLPLRAMPGPPHATYRHDIWTAYYSHPYQHMIGTPSPGPFDQRYRDDQTGWIAADYPGPPYGPAFTTDPLLPPPPGDFMNVDQHPSPGSSKAPEKRGRKRTRTVPQPAPPAATLVVTKRNPNARSPTPPSRVVKSTYGGNLFTPEDIEYLRKYIQYCQDQGLVLSLREICERIAVKAPHHTFYSWRRYCNKHQIRLGGYSMGIDRSPSPAGSADPGPEGAMDPIEETDALASMGGTSAPHISEPARELAEALAAGDITALEKHFSANPPTTSRLPITPSMVATPLPSTSNLPMLHAPPPVAPFAADVGVDLTGSVARNRSPTPPRALFRSTTGKGVAFTPEDVSFLVKFLEYRQSQGKLDMVTFWKEVANKAPHHSRASWMKYYRRHKHELHPSEGDEPLPQAPEKKLRYSHADDILLAKYFQEKPDGTSDKVFQSFARQYPHHPWKGWQEHHRIHKTQIDHLIQRLKKGEVIDDLPIIEANEQPTV